MTFGHALASPVKFLLRCEILAGGNLRGAQVTQLRVFVKKSFNKTTKLQTQSLAMAFLIRVGDG
jgi:hypothetical protein